MNSTEKKILKDLRIQYLDLLDLADHDEEHGDEESYDATMNRIRIVQRKIENLENRDNDDEA